MEGHHIGERKCIWGKGEMKKKGKYSARRPSTGKGEKKANRDEEM